VETFRTDPISLPHMLSSIHERQLALPDFQRDFVWDARATEELIESICRSFPAGTLLFMPWRDDVFTPRAVQGAPDLNGSNPNQLILDGQQRLSSLYQACYGAGEYRYFAALQPLLGDGGIEDAIFYRRKNRCKRIEEIGTQAEELVLPLAKLFSPGHSFHAWLDQICQVRDEDPEQQTELRGSLRKAYESYIKPLEEYRFPVVELSSQTKLEAICSIFETLNRTGIKLSVFDLLAARFYAKGLDLRRQWQDTTQLTPIIEEFGIDRYYLLQSIALRAKGSVKRGDVLDLTVDEMTEHWHSVVEGYRAALEMLRDECGVRAGKWLPYGYLLVPLAALWADLIETGGPSSALNRVRFKQWFWCSGFSAAYDRAANTQADRDYLELRRWAESGQEPTTVSGFAFDRSRLREITPKQQSVYKALMALVISNGARDFHHGQELTAASIAAQNVDDHHIFPRAFLNPTDQDRAYPTQLVDCILNRTLIDTDTNQRIGKRPPGQYLGELAAQLDQADSSAFEQVLDSHLLPSGVHSPLLAADFPAFLDWREDRIAERMASLTGKPISDLSAEEESADAPD
jgi:hypothetical protein